MRRSYSDKNKLLNLKLITQAKEKTIQESTLSRTKQADPIMMTSASNIVSQCCIF